MSIEVTHINKDMNDGQEKALASGNGGRVGLDRHLLLTTTQGPDHLTKSQILENYTYSPPVYMSINAISNAVGRINYQWEDEQEPSNFNMERPNKHHTWRQFVSILAKYMKLLGEAYVIKVNGIDGISLLPIRPDYIEKYREDEVHLNTPIMEQTTYDFDEVIYMHEPSVLDPYYEGESEGQALGTEMDIFSNGASHVSAYLKNNARPDMIMAIRGNKQALEQFKETTKNNFKGPNNAGKTMAVPDGEIDVETLSSSFKDLQMDDIRQTTMTIMRQTFGIPPEMVGIVENSNRSTIESAEYIFNRNVIEPLVKTILDTINNQFVRQDLGSQYALTYEDFIPENKEQKIEEKKLKLKVMKEFPEQFSDQEKRELAGFDPTEGTMQSSNEDQT